MATLQVIDMDDNLYENLRRLAKIENRSISQEVVTIIREYLSNPNHFKINTTQEFLKLSGSWEDKRDAEDIIEDISFSRTNSSRFEDKNGFFD